MKFWLFSLPLTVFIFSNPDVVKASSTTRVENHPEIRIILNSDKTHSYIDRLSAVQNLPLDLQPASLDCLLNFLEQPVSTDTLARDYLNAIKNDVVVMILRQNRFYPPLSNRLLEMSQKKELDLVWRDYAIQYFPACFIREENPSMKTKILETLWKITREETGNFVGTALLGLNRIADKSSDEDLQKELAERAYQIAEDENISTPSRITAIQVASSANKNYIFLRSIATNTSADILTRMAALNLLGASLSSEDMLILEELAQSSDIRLRAAARSALENDQEQ